jgi:hypothetical protein
MNLNDLISTEMYIEEKLEAWQCYVQEYAQAKAFGDEQSSGRRRLAQFLIGLGLTLDPEAAERINVPARAITPATD